MELCVKFVLHLFDDVSLLTCSYFYIFAQYGVGRQHAMHAFFSNIH
jgi:hypothetical protein